MSENVRLKETPLPESGFRPHIRPPVDHWLTPSPIAVNTSASPIRQDYCQTASRTPIMAYDITGYPMLMRKSLRLRLSSDVITAGDA